MRNALVTLILLILPALPAALAQDSPEPANRAGPLLEEGYSVPDLGAQGTLLEDRFRTLGQRLQAMRERASREGLDQRLGELFLPERPDAFANYYAVELRIAKTGGDPGDWRQIAETYLERGALDDAAAAGFRLYREAQSDRVRAKGLTVMAEAYLAKGDLRPAINLYRTAFKIHPAGQTRQRYEALIERYDLRLKDIAIDVETRLPAACLVFSQVLAKRLPLPVADYIQVEPGSDIDISARDERVCLRGLSHGEDYRLRIRPGLVGSQGGRMHGAIERRFQVPDRAQRVTFSANSYVLPRASAQALPVTTVNLQQVDMKVYRIDDRNLIVPILSGQMDLDLYAGAENQIGQSTGSQVWQGSLEVENHRNEEVTTLVPLDRIIPHRKAGLYILVGRTPDEKEAMSWQRHATQWLVVSDLGLVSFQGDDGQHVLVRSLESAEPVADAALTLVARNNTVLGHARSDGQGLARFPPGLLRGTGGDRPAFVTVATAEGDYNFLRLVGAALDLSERGQGGRPAPKGLDAFLYSERGVYRPGEKVFLSALLRDAGAKAKGDLPLTLKVVRPGGVEVFNHSATGDEFGGYLFEVPLSPAARAGSWSASAFLDPEQPPVGSLSFQVEDFVPPRLEAALSSGTPWLARGKSADALLAGKFLYGPPAADLATEAGLALLVNPRPFPDYADYKFGLAQETFRPQRRQLESPRTDRNGEAVIRLTVEKVPDSSHPLMAELRVALLDAGGRPIDSRLRLPLRLRDVEVGLRPRFSGSLGGGAEASFDLLALDPSGQPVPGRRVAYQWITEIHDYGWYQQAGEWRFRRTVYDEVVAAGEVQLGDDGKGRLNRQLDNGRYRLEIIDPESDSASSYRFSAGWWHGPAAPDVPDALEVSLEKTELGSGDTLKAFVRAPFAGSAMVMVMSGGLRHIENLVLPAEGAEITLPVEAAWAPGAYVLVTAFRPQAGRPSPLPVRAMGLAWFSVDRNKHQLDVKIEAPPNALPRQTLTLPITVAGATDDQPVHLTLAAVDEGILQLTGFASPSPEGHYLGQRRLEIDLRDLYGRLIRPAAGRSGLLRSGGDRAAMENAQGIALKTVKTVALYQRDIVTDEQGRAAVTLELPDFNGRLRLMAVAYGKNRIGGGTASLTVRDPLVADLLLPRFLATGDEAKAILDLHNLSGAALDLSVTVTAEGAVSLAGEAGLTLSLDDEKRHSESVAVLGATVGEGRLRLSVRGEGLTPIDRQWDIQVRAAQPYVTRRQVRYLEPGARVALSEADLEGLLSETASIEATVTDVPDFNLADLLGALDRYPYGCSEQTISRALPLLYYGDLAEAADLTREDRDSQRKIERAIRRLLERQRSDGSFAVWQSYGPSHAWLTAYSFDFLTRARAAGFDVPPAVYEQSLTWLQTFAERERNPPFARAYAYYALARIGKVKASSLRYFAETEAMKIRTRLGLGHTAAALAILGERGRAEGLFERAIAKRRPRSTWIPDYGSDLRDGAAIAALLAETFPDGTRLQRLASALEDAFGQRQYFSTQEQAWLVLATHGLSRKAGEGFRITVNGQVTRRQEPLRAKLSGEMLAAGYGIRNVGEGPLRLITATRAVPRDPLPAVADGFTLRRSFLRPDGSLATVEAVKQNERFLVLIEGKAENDQDQQALLVDLLPAGFEIENAALGGEAVKASFGFLPVLSETAFSAARDDRFVAALDLRGGQRFAVAYLVRAVTPGRYSLAGSFIEDMYRPRYHARTAGSSITVAAR